MLNPELYECLSNELIRIDDKIKEIIQFGSSVYSPLYAHSNEFNDIDLFVFTSRRKDPGEHQFKTRYGIEIESIRKRCNIPWKLDIFDNLNHDYRLFEYRYHIFAFGKIVFGNGDHIRRVINKDKLTSINQDNEISMRMNKVNQDTQLETKVERLYYTILEASARYITIKKLEGRETTLPSSFKTFYEKLKKNPTKDASEFQSLYKEAMTYISDLEI